MIESDKCQLDTYLFQNFWSVVKVPLCDCEFIANEVDKRKQGRTNFHISTSNYKLKGDVPCFLQMFPPPATMASLDICDKFLQNCKKIYP